MDDGVTHSHRNEANDNLKVIEEFRANTGRVGGRWSGTTLVLIHHVGVRSGCEHVTPLGCFIQEDGGFIIVASNGGSVNHPAWFHNLKAQPKIEVELGSECFTVITEELNETARAELWPKLVADAPQLDAFQQRVTRQIPVLRLRRVD